MAIAQLLEQLQEPLRPPVKNGLLVKLAGIFKNEGPSIEAFDMKATTAVLLKLAMGTERTLLKSGLDAAFQRLAKGPADAEFFNFLAKSFGEAAKGSRDMSVNVELMKRFHAVLLTTSAWHGNKEVIKALAATCREISARMLYSDSFVHGITSVSVSPLSIASKVQWKNSKRNGKVDLTGSKRK